MSNDDGRYTAYRNWPRSAARSRDLQEAFFAGYDAVPHDDVQRQDALALLSKIMEGIDDPFALGWLGGDQCFFCAAIRSHEGDCEWEAARVLAGTEETSRDA